MPNNILCVLKVPVQGGLHHKTHFITTIGLINYLTI